MRRLGSVAAAVLAGLAVPGRSQDEPAVYAGRMMCLLCHKQTHPKIVDRFPQSGHARAMAAASAETIVADFSTAPFERDRVAFTLGSGRYQQAYLDPDLRVLPAKWLVAERAWRPIEPVDGATECVGCHVTDYDPEKKTWKELGVGCEMCHGPGSKHNVALGPAQKTTILDPGGLKPQRLGMLCGQCHSRGRDVSGRYAFPVHFVPGEELDPFFTDAQPEEAGMNQQFSDLRRSPGHYTNDVVCTDCHDPHGDTEQSHQRLGPTDELCLRCHAGTVKSLAEHTAEKQVEAPEGADCATCHMPEGRHLFDKTVRAR